MAVNDFLPPMTAAAFQDYGARAKNLRAARDADMLAGIYNDRHIRERFHADAVGLADGLRHRLRDVANRAAEAITDARLEVARAEKYADDGLDWQRITGKQAEYAAALSAIPQESAPPVGGLTKRGQFIRQKATAAAAIGDQHTIRALATAGADIIAESPALRVAFEGYAREALGDLSAAATKERVGLNELWSIETVVSRVLDPLGDTLSPGTGTDIIRAAIGPHMELLGSSLVPSEP